MDNGRTIRGEDVTTSVWQSAPVPALSDFAVQPRSLSLFRAEEMTTLAGAIRLEGDGAGRRVVNGTDLELRDATLIDIIGPEREQWKERYLGTIGPGASVEIGEAAAAKAPERIEAGPGPDPDTFLRVVRTTWEPRDENSGEIRLVAWVAAADAGPGDRAGRRTASAGTRPCWCTSAAARRPARTGRTITWPSARSSRPSRPARAPAGPAPRCEPTPIQATIRRDLAGRGPRHSHNSPLSTARRISAGRRSRWSRRDPWRRTTDDRGDQLHQALRRFHRRGRPELLDRQGGDLRLHRAQRRRQEHDHPVPGDACCGRPRARAGSRATRSPPSRCRSAG